MSCLLFGGHQLVYSISDSVFAIFMLQFLLVESVFVEVQCFIVQSKIWSSRQRRQSETMVRSKLMRVYCVSFCRLH